MTQMKNLKQLSKSLAVLFGCISLATAQQPVPPLNLTACISTLPCPKPNIATTKLPLWSLNQLIYSGGFRIDNARTDSTSYSTTNFSTGIFTIDTSKNSIFISGHSAESQIAEYQLPTIVNTRNVSLFDVATKNLQPFFLLHDPLNGFDTGITEYFRVTGMEVIDGQLVVNYFNWYDANGNETDTTSIFKDAYNLSNSKIVGPFQITGAARAGGWLTPIPPEWQTELGGTYISGWSKGSIISRLSNGPSGYIIPGTSMNLLTTSMSGQPLSSREALNFPLNNILYNTSIYSSIYDGSFDNNERILLNQDRTNDLWTHLSDAVYGFIIPGTNTYVTIGWAAGIYSGIEYKLHRPDGTSCPGHCPIDPEDSHNYAWLWKVTDLIDVLNGHKQPYEIRPYEYGVIDTLGFKEAITGGHFDPKTKKLYVSLALADKSDQYGAAPLFFTYDVQ